MNISLGISCLVAMALLEGVIGVSDQRSNKEDQLEDYDKKGSPHGIQVRKKLCRSIGGKCVRRKKECPNGLPLETKRGSPFCYKRNRCCYPVTTSALTTTKAPTTTTQFSVTTPALTTTGAPTTNPPGAFYIGDQLFTIGIEAVSWALANERCSSLNARLAVLDNPQDFHTYFSSKYVGSRFWLGASDITQEGTWTWINNQSLAGFPWLNGEPNNFQGNEDCLEWGHLNNFVDTNCDRGQGYVCEHVTTPALTTIGAPTTNPPDSCLSAAGTRVAGQCLFFEKAKKTWEDSIKSCEIKGLRLASILDPTAFNTYMKSNFAGEWFWLGGTDSANEGRWIWLNGNTFVGFPWESVQPDDKYGNQDCLLWGWHNTFDDMVCTRETRYICEL